MDGPTLAQTYLCGTCHNFEDATPGAGPSLYDVGARMTAGEIYESIMDPDATITEGYAGGVMTATLNGVGFYDKITTKEMQNLVEYLLSLKG